ncbi:MAG: Uma2 family endonuclease [Caldilineales bacterium]
MTAQRSVMLTPQEYLKMERAAEYKSEYYAGEVFAMVGASPRHVLIATNTAAVLVGELKKRPCMVYSADLRVKVSASGLYTYPDIIVACKKPEFDDPREDTLLNPSVIVEVLSPSTEAYDRGAKFNHYRKIESLTDYLLISQDRALVEHYVRQPDEDPAAGNSGTRWLLTVYQGLENIAVIPSIDVELPLSEIYDKVEWPEDEGGSRTLRAVREEGNGYATEAR